MNLIESVNSFVPPGYFVPTVARFANNYLFNVAYEGERSENGTVVSVAKTALSSIVSVVKDDFSFAPTLLSNFINTIFDTDQGSVAGSCNPWRECFKEVKGHRDIIEDPINGWLERFVKVEINKPIEPGTIIRVPIKTGDEFYKVHQKFAKEGLVAYALTPLEKGKKLEPLLVFRATEVNLAKEEGLNSLKNDLGQHIGEKGWNASKFAFADLMNDLEFRAEGEKIKVAGYSLGGAQAQYFIDEHYRNVSHGIFYNAPSIDAAVVEAFAEKVDRSLLLQIYRTVGDPCHLFGGKQLGWGVKHPEANVQLLDIEYPSLSGFDLTLHRRRIFDTSQFDYSVRETRDPEQLMNLLDNQTRNPVSGYTEAGRRILSLFFSTLS